MRAIPEWIGKTDDSRPPPRVRMRIFLNHDGRCHITGRKIVPSDHWDCEHVIALCNGGENRESNLAPALAEPHRKIKTPQDVKIKAKTDRIRRRHLGIRKHSTFPCSRDSGFKKKISGEVVRRWPT